MKKWTPKHQLSFLVGPPLLHIRSKTFDVNVFESTFSPSSLPWWHTSSRVLWPQVQLWRLQHWGAWFSPRFLLQDASHLCQNPHLSPEASCGTQPLVAPCIEPLPGRLPPSLASVCRSEMNVLIKWKISSILLHRMLQKPQHTDKFTA